MSTSTNAPATAQKALILEHLKKGKPITPREARTLCGCDRLSARIYDLRKEFTISGEMIRTPSGKRVASYTLQP